VTAKYFELALKFERTSQLTLNSISEQRDKNGYRKDPKYSCHKIQHGGGGVSSDVCFSGSCLQCLVVEEDNSWTYCKQSNKKKKTFFFSLRHSLSRRPPAVQEAWELWIRDWFVGGLWWLKQARPFAVCFLKASITLGRSVIPGDVIFQVSPLGD